jgi:multiple sugar transport system ATP-binding protein
MGRAIVRNPSVYLMDEPLSNLDAKLRVQMRTDIAALQAELGVTTVYVTHDQAEAMTLGHRVAVLNEALLQQCDTPRALYERPANVFVAGFIGSPSMNFWSAPPGYPTAGVSRRRRNCVASGHPWQPAQVLVPAQVPELSSDGVPKWLSRWSRSSSDAYVFCSVELAGEETKLVAPGRCTPRPQRGERIAFRPPADEVHVFDAKKS